MSKYKELRIIDVSAETKKKGRFTYLPWTYAIDTLLLHDPEANWSYTAPIEHNQTMMVGCSVTAFNKTMTEFLPVIDGTNKAITNPNSMQVNNAMKRCLVKAIALHGIGLSLYAGDEFWDEPEESSADKIIQQLEACKTADELKAVFGLAWAELKTKKQKEQIQPIYEKKKVELNATSARATK